VLPDVSVIIPTRNRLPLLKIAIASCFHGNNDVVVEVIVVDDGSTDGTPQYLEGLGDSRVEFIRQESRGPQVARNAGLERVGGRFVKFLDDDDWLAPGALRRELTRADATAADVCSGDINVVDEKGALICEFPTSSGNDLFVELAMGRTTTHPLRFLIKRRLAQQVRWNPEIKCRQDVDYFLRIGLLARKPVSLHVNVGFFRQHTNARVSTVSAEAGPRQQLEIFLSLARTFKDMGLNAEPRRMQVLRDALWSTAHHCAVYDLAAARQGWALSESLGEAGYHPVRSNPVLTWSDRVLGAQATERLLLLPRRVRKAFSAF